MTGQICISMYNESDKELFRRARRRVANERGCDPEEVGRVELFRALAHHRLNNPSGVQIQLNGGSDIILRALEKADGKDPADALAEVAEDALRFKERNRALSGGAQYTGDSA